MKWLFVQNALLVGVLTALPTMAGAAEQSAGAFPRMDVVGFARAPAGFISFCKRHPLDCVAPDAVRKVVLTSKAMTQLETVNNRVNLQVQPVTDRDLYGVEEFWAYPTDKGDCEDYVLLKRKLLMQAGWPVSSLLITVVRDRAGEGHAVLTVVTDRGDLVLDNQREGVLPWNQSPYVFVKRQSQTDPKMWVFVGPYDDQTGVASTP